MIACRRWLPISLAFQSPSSLRTASRRWQRGPRQRQYRSCSKAVSILSPAASSPASAIPAAKTGPLPPNPTSEDYRGFQTQVIEAGAKALEAAGVHYAVALSSFGADKESGSGPVSGLHELEVKLQRISSLNAVFLRAGYFMENVIPQVSVIQNFGIVGGPVRPDLPLPLIATEDIGASAAERLLKLDFSGHETRELLGQRDITYTEAARILGAAIGKPDLAYVQLPPDQFTQALVQMGLSNNFANLIVEMAGAMNDGRMKALEPRSSANTTPTSFEEFVQKEFLPAYRGKAATA